MGLAPTGKAPPCHGARGTRTLSGFDSDTHSYAFQQYDQTKLTRTSSSSYEMLSRDGTRKIFSRSDGAAGTSRKIFLTEFIDSFGNAVSLTYDSNFRLVAITAENHIGRSALGSASDRSCRRSLRHVLGFSFTLSTAAIHEMRVSKIVISLPYFRAPCVNVRLGNDGLGCIHLSAAQKSQPGYKGGYDASSSVTGRTGCRSRITGQCKCPSARELADVRPKPAAHV